MSIKDDVNYIKNEISNEEKFLESFVKTERFFKKYKKIILAVGSLLLVSLVAYFVKSSIDEKRLYEANVSLNEYLQTGNLEVLNRLKEQNSTLYEIALYTKAKKDLQDENISLQYLKDILDFQIATSSSNSQKLQNLMQKSDFLLKDYAIFNRAFILVNDGKYQEARDLLEQISKDSKAFELATLLKHYLVTK